MSIVDFVRDGSRMAFYRDISEIMNKAGLYDNQKEKDKEKHFEKIVDLLEETDFNGNWFDANWVLTSDIKNMCELLEIDGEQFRLYVGSFKYQVWVDTYESESESEESDSDGEEDSGQGAVEDSEWQCHLCGEDYPSEIDACPVCSGDKFRCETCYKVCDWEVKVEPDEDENADDEVCYDCYMKSVDDKDEDEEELRTCDCCGKDKYTDGSLMKYSNMVEQEQEQEWFCKVCDAI